jgi:hypothetical protein
MASRVTEALDRDAKPICTFMNIVDLTKATIICGGTAFLIYTFPVLAQAVIIGLLSLLWLGYAHRTVIRWLRR